MAVQGYPRSIIILFCKFGDAPLGDDGALRSEGPMLVIRVISN